jgi:threonine dehydrogenase-like Zn-dependent dehydrogenase
MILGHEAVGRIDKVGTNVRERQLGERVGVAWIYSAGGTEDTPPELIEAIIDTTPAWRQVVAALS